MNEIRQFNFTKNQTALSFGVVSRFTNVPLAESIDIIIERMHNRYTNNNDKANPTIKAETFKKLMFTTTKGTFMYNDKVLPWDFH